MADDIKEIEMYGRNLDCKGRKVVENRQHMAKIVISNASNYIFMNVSKEKH